MGVTLGGPWQAAFAGGSPAKHDLRYPLTPPELVPFAAQNVDGIHYGFVARTPELAADDYLVGDYCPADSDPVWFLGTNFAEGIETLASRRLAFLADEGEELSDRAASDLAAISKLLKIKPSPGKADRQFTRSGHARRVPMRRPRGYEFRQTLDGIGVLAPRLAFASNAKMHDPKDMAKSLQEASNLLKGGSPASALVILRDLWWVEGYLWPAAQCVGTKMATCYEQLNRGEFAEVVRQKVRQREQWSREGPG